MRMEVVVALQVEGLHHWPAARDCGAGEVGYLEHTHRHTFHIRVSVCVCHPDRYVEFLRVGDWLRQHLVKRYGDPCKFGEMSCEALCLRVRELLAMWVYEFGDLDVTWVEVLEDGQGGARVTW